MTGDALADGDTGSAKASGAMSDEGDATGGTRRAEVGPETGEGRTFPWDFFSLARLF